VTVIRPEDISQAVIDAAQKADYDGYRELFKAGIDLTGWQRVPDDQLRRLIAAAFNQRSAP
jgi:hypothetical protein